MTARPEITLEGCAVPQDSVTAEERVNPKRRAGERRGERARAMFPAACAVVALLALLSGNIHYRERIIDLKEQQAAEIAKYEARIQALTPAPVYDCEVYTSPMDGLTIEHCVKPGVRM